MVQPGAEGGLKNGLAANLDLDAKASNGTRCRGFHKAEGHSAVIERHVTALAGHLAWAAGHVTAGFSFASTISGGGGAPFLLHPP